jgi:hypothetical protein
MINLFNPHKSLVWELYKFFGQQLLLFGATCGVAVMIDNSSCGNDWGGMCEVRNK